MPAPREGPARLSLPAAPGRLARERPPPRAAAPASGATRRRDHARLRIPAARGPHLEAARALVHELVPGARGRCGRTCPPSGRAAETARTAFRHLMRRRPDPRDEARPRRLPRGDPARARAHAVRRRPDRARRPRALRRRVSARFPPSSSITRPASRPAATSTPIRGRSATSARSIRGSRASSRSAARTRPTSRAALPGVGVGVRRPGVTAPGPEAAAPPRPTAAPSSSSGARTTLRTRTRSRGSRPTSGRGSRAQAPGARCVATGGSVSPQLAQAASSPPGSRTRASSPTSPPSSPRRPSSWPRAARAGASA